MCIVLSHVRVRFRVRVIFNLIVYYTNNLLVLLHVRVRIRVIFYISYIYLIVYCTNNLLVQLHPSILAIFHHLDH